MKHLEGIHHIQLLKNYPLWRSNQKTAAACPQSPSAPFLRSQEILLMIHHLLVSYFTEHGRDKLHSSLGSVYSQMRLVNKILYAAHVQSYHGKQAAYTVANWPKSPWSFSKGQVLFLYTLVFLRGGGVRRSPHPWMQNNRKRDTFHGKSHSLASKRSTTFFLGHIPVSDMKHISQGEWMPIFVVKWDN